MKKRFRIHLIIAGFLLMMSMSGIVTAAGLAHTWTERTPTDTPFSGVMFSMDDSTVYAGGSQVFVRSWNGDTRWWGWSGTIASTSADGNYTISATGRNIYLINKSGEQLWIVGTNTPVRAVAISSDGSLIVGADDSGNIFSWGTKDESRGMIKTDLVKQIAISPSGSLIVVTTEAGITYFTGITDFTPQLTQIWVDNKSGSLESFIEISADSSTVITSGENRVSSHTSRGVLNWRKDMTPNAITDIACSDDCTTIVLGSQEGNVWVLNQFGKEQWKYPAGSWINGVGVSRDGSIIAAGTLDRNLYILDKEGQLLAKTRTDTIIQPRSVAVSRDGKRIVVADQVALYGFELLGEPEVTSRETFTPASLFPATSSTPVPINSTLPKTILPTTTVPVTTSTPASSLNPGLAIVALSGLLLIAIRRNN
jgi:DNA-binding beta-propeller fold protein YncE